MIQYRDSLTPRCYRSCSHCRHLHQLYPGVGRGPTLDTCIRFSRPDDVHHRRGCSLVNPNWHWHIVPRGSLDKGDKFLLTNGERFRQVSAAPFSWG